MIELVFVIVVLGILASLAMGRMERDLRQEASETVLSHIRLAQQLALNDNKHRSDNNAQWQRAYWRFEYRKCTGIDFQSTRVGSDMDRDGSIDKTESAVDPMNGKYIYTNGNCDDLASDESPSVSVLRKAGVKSIVRTGGCSATGQYIAFDYLGRPHHGVTSSATADFQSILTSDCSMTFRMSSDVDNDGDVDDDDSFTITVESETGHVFIVGQEDS